MEMNEQIFDKLRALQEILSKRFEIEHQLEEIPRVLSENTEVLNRMKKTYIERNEEFERTKENITSLKLRMSEAEEKRESLERMMDQINTQREYEALDKEIQDAGEREITLRKDLQREEKHIDEMIHALEQLESTIRQQESELTEEKEKVILAEGETRELLNSLKEEEASIVPDLDPEILFKFERIIRSKSGLGIVAVKRGVCTGCHMILPAQYVNDVRTGESIEFCPYCSRILYFQLETDNQDSYFQDEEGGSLSDLDDYDGYDDDEMEDDDDSSDSDDSDFIDAD